MKKNGAVKKLKHSTLALVLTIIFIVIVVVVNVIATELSERFPTTIDATQKSVYSLSNKTKDFLKKIDDDVIITVLAKENEFCAISDYTAQTAELIKKYAKYNSHISYRFIDYISNPDILSQYQQENLAENQIIIESNPKGEDGKTYKRVRVISLFDLFEFSEDFQNYISSYYGMSIEQYLTATNININQLVQYYGDTIISASNAENALTSAVSTVVNPVVKHIALLTGRAEESRVTFENFKNTLKINGYETQEIDITKQEIPEDTDVAVILAPTVDYTSAEIKKVADFLLNGGELGKNLIYCASVSQPETPNINEFLQEYGVEIPNETICEGNSDNYFTYPDFIGVGISSDEYLSSISLDKDKIKLYAPDSRPIILKNNTPQVLAKTSEKAYTIKYPDITKLNEGEKNVIVVASKNRTDEQNQPVYSNILLLGSANMLADEIFNATQFNNQKYLMAVINSLAGSSEIVTIDSKVISADKFKITKTQYRILQITFQYALPAIVLTVGIIVWIKRKNL